MKSSCDVIHDASNLLDLRPACVVELSGARFAQTKDQTAHGTWPRKHKVHGLAAQKRRAGVLATAGARACPKGARGQRDEATVACQKSGMYPTLIPQPEWDKYHLFRDLSHI